jgi:tetratricopeptide (TPR) repeat protein
VSNLLIGLLSALVSTNQPSAVSNLVEKTTGISIEVPNPNDPVEKEYLNLLHEDDAAQTEVDKWILEDRTATNRSTTLTLRIKQRFDSVKKAYQEFLQRNPKHVKAHLAFGSFLQEIREEAEAVKHWEKAREIDPKNPAAWNNLANYYGHHSPVEKSFEYYAKAIELNPAEPVYYWNFATTVYLFRKHAMEFYKIDETQVFDKALDLYRQAMKLAPNDFILASDYAQSFYGTKPPRLKDGLSAWTDAMKIARDDIERDGVRIHLARINWKLNNFDEARLQLGTITNEMYSTTKKKLLKNIEESEKKSNETDAPSKLEK